MKIVYFIGSIKKTNEGIGGHYYSLLETAKQIARKHEVIIINIGIKLAKSLVDCPHLNRPRFCRHLEVKWTPDSRQWLKCKS